MKPGVYNLKIYCGTTTPLLFVYKTDGTPVNLTGYKARFSIATELGSVLLNLDSESGAVSVGAESGEISLELSAAQTSALWGRWCKPHSESDGDMFYQSGKWSIELESADAKVTRLIYGSVLVSKESA